MILNIFDFKATCGSIKGIKLLCISEQVFGLTSAPFEAEYISQKNAKEI